jgi:hypothetical protein
MYNIIKMKLTYYLTILLFLGLVKSDSILNNQCNSCAIICNNKKLVDDAKNLIIYSTLLQHM